MISELITLVGDNLSESFNSIGKAYSINPLDNLQTETPACLFLPGKDSGGEPTGWNPIKQPVIRRVHVFILAPVDEIQGLSNLLRPLLVTYRPFGSKSYSLLAFESGELTEIKGVGWYVETYYTRHELSTI